MPASQTRRDGRGRWLSVLFWTGVALALPAVLSLLLGQGESSLRLATALAILCVVFIGLSIALRGDAGAFRAQVESLVLDEIDALREENRENIVAVARKLHSTLREDATDLADQIEELRDQLSTGGSSVRTSQDAVSLSRGLVRVDSTAQWRQTTAASAGVGLRGGNGAGASATASASGARAVSGLPQRSAPVWSQAGDRREQPAATGQVSPSPVSSGAVSESLDPGGVFPNSTTYSSDGYPPDTGRPTGRGYPSVGNHSNGNIYQGGNRSAGRRRAPEPEAPRVAIESGHRTTDPWADLRDDTEDRSYRGSQP